MRSIIGSRQRTRGDHRLLRAVLAVLVVAALLIGTSTARAAGTPEQQCAAGKNKTAGKYATCRENAEAKLAAGGEASKYADAIAKCETKFSMAWVKLEAKATAAGASCPADDSTIKGQTETYTNRVAALVAGNRLVDNGDGTVTDNETGLQWEKKTNLDSTPNLGDPHDADNIYSWTLMFPDTSPNGTVFVDFLDKLNGGLGPNTCFAGHCDWRLPSLAELPTILLAPYPCGPSPCIDPVFGPTVADFYWSATSYDVDPRFAMSVFFQGGGGISEPVKASNNYVRAVRTGS